MTEPGSASWQGGNSAFEPGFQTEWLVVRKAGQPGPQAAAALERLCRTYWYPLYAFVRRRGHDPEQALDLTQGFFAHLLARPWLKDVEASKGRFRAFLLASMNNYLTNEWRRGHAQKRGGGQAPLSLDAITAEDRYRLEPAHHQSPDLLFDRAWAAGVLQRANTRLTEECAGPGKRALFEELKGVLSGERCLHGYAEVATRLRMTEAAVKKTVQRLRTRYQELLRAEVALTVDGAAAVEEEIRCLFGALWQ